MTRMIQSVAQPELNRTSSVREAYLEGYRWMLLARVLDDKLASFVSGREDPWRGVSGAGAGGAERGDWLGAATGDVFAPLVRDLAGRLAFGETVLDVVRTFMGSALGPMRGEGWERASGAAAGGAVADDQSFGGDDCGGERDVVGAADERRGWGGRGELYWGRRDFDGFVSRGIEPGGGRAVATGAGGGEQLLCIFDAECAAVCLSRPGGSGGRLRSGGAFGGWDGFGGVFAGGVRGGAGGAWKGGPSAGGGPAAAVMRAWGAR
jgi:hypothetical protein